jgi:hypothetical protein
VIPAEVRDQVRASRLAQNLPPVVEDLRFLTALAAELLEPAEAGEAA